MVMLAPALVVGAMMGLAILSAATSSAATSRGFVLRKNPPGIRAVSPGGNPLAGATFFIDRDSGAASRQAQAWRWSHPQWASLLDVIAGQPGTQRFGGWNGPDPQGDVSAYLARAAGQEPGTVPMISTYRVVNGHCGNYTPPPSEMAAYDRWISGFARGIGNRRAVLFLEMDSLITMGCLSPRGVTLRAHELRDAIAALSFCPHLVTYLDAGAADAGQPSRVARLLRRAGVALIQGFFLNSTHFDWTSKEVRFGERVSRLIGGKHFIVNTGENGQGPIVPRDRVHKGNEVLCNPPNRGLGPRPTTNTGYPNVDAFAWTSNPGESGGQCVPGAPPTGAYWPQYAIGLVRHANFDVR
jgi:endoglucanase